LPRSRWSFHRARRSEVKGPGVTSARTRPGQGQARPGTRTGWPPTPRPPSRWGAECSGAPPSTMYLGQFLAGLLATDHLVRIGGQVDTMASLPLAPIDKRRAGVDVSVRGTYHERMPSRCTVVQALGGAGSSPMQRTAACRRCQPRPGPKRYVHHHSAPVEND
jgi:hypothetical protein